MTMDELKLALRVTVSDYDTELAALAAAALEDLRSAGVLSAATMAAVKSPLEAQAVKTYVRVHFGSPPDRDALAQSYALQKMQLMHTTGHTDWRR